MSEVRPKVDKCRSVQIVLKYKPMEQPTDKFGNPVNEDPSVDSPIFLADALSKINFSGFKSSNVFEISDEPNKMSGINYDNDDEPILIGR